VSLGVCLASISVGYPYRCFASLRKLAGRHVGSFRRIGRTARLKWGNDSMEPIQEYAAARSKSVVKPLVLCRNFVCVHVLEQGCLLTRGDRGRV
jgi:hypothetical protein